MFHFKEDNKNNNLINIGTSGNWVRPSTGYSFQNSFINAKDITEKLLKKKDLKINTNKRIKFLDKIFCYYIANIALTQKCFLKVFSLKINLKI